MVSIFFRIDSLYKQNVPLISPGKLLTPRENQQLIRQETRNRTTVDCCPSVLEMIEPEGGKNQDDQYVELYRDGDHRQRFYELSCHKDIKNKPCRFMDKKIHEHSRCVQKYSYTYALVKDTGRHHHHQKISNKNFPTFPARGPEEVRWTLDYIRVRSGCSCVVTSNKQKRKQKHKRIKHDEETWILVTKVYKPQNSYLILFPQYFTIASGLWLMLLVHRYIYK